MEKINSNLSKKVIISLFNKIQTGYIELEDELSCKHFFGNKEQASKENSVSMKIHNELFYKKCLIYGTVGVGEAYTEGLWDCDALEKFIYIMILNRDELGVQSGAKSKKVFFNLLKASNKVKHALRSNSKKGSAKNISFHYDLSNEFYSLMLDETMTYSCGVFKEEDEYNLLEAQNLKYQKLCQDLQLKKGDHVLEIGSGWGGFANYAAKNYGAKITSITISKQQLRYCQSLIEKEQLSDQVQVVYCDYRDIKNLGVQFDKAISIEMIEAVGDKYYETYFKSVFSCLKPSGLFVIQAITSPDSRYEEFKNGVDWIQKHIFPGSLLPSLKRLLDAVYQVSDYQIESVRDIGLDYAKTLKLWRSNFNDNLEKVKALGFDNQFIRSWTYYLCYCEAAFKSKNISDLQICLVRPNRI